MHPRQATVVPAPSWIVVLSAPSGAGKTTVVRALLEREPQLQFAVSHTTRPPRPHEVHGQDYYFVTPDEFRDLIGQGAFVEWAVVHGHFYGTSQAELRRILEAGKTPLLDIDVQGAYQIQRRWPHGLFIMLLPPSWTVLEQRLRQRGDLTDEQVRRRIGQARREVRWAWMYDYWVVNDVLDEAVETIEAILWSHRHRPGVGPTPGRLPEIPE
ncbi:Guanylate kinase [bacterium HR11]|nr:Guanylate kinase [bacterium HR11]